MEYRPQGFIINLTTLLGQYKADAHRVLYIQVGGMWRVYIVHSKKVGWGWRDGSLVKSTNCSCSATRFGLNSQYLHGGLQPSVTIVTGDQCPILSLWALHTCSTLASVQVNTHTHKIKNLKSGLLPGRPCRWISTQHNGQG
jgi:hypothetical protein